MEESCEVYSDDNKVLPEKKQKRRVKTPFQVKALEKFYNEHKYPTESMKLELAESLGLTEKQISGWFCHRRLKDKKLVNGEAYALGRQDRSSVVIQDHGSGLRQDSCGSTKQGDYKHYDAREVESRRFTGLDISAADPTYELGTHTGIHSSTDDTSSGSSSPLEDRFSIQNVEPFGVTTLRCLPQNGNIAPIDVKGLKGRTGPSGYLKVKDQVENAAITDVKRQLGRHYREDGPPLGVEFEPLPPGAFESSIKDPINQAYYDGEGERSLLHSSDAPKIFKQPNPGTRYEGYNSKMSSHNSDLEETSFKIMHGSNHHENYSLRQLKQNPYLSNHSNPYPGQNSSMGRNEDSTRETSVYDIRDKYEMRAKHDIGQRRMESVSSHHLRPYGGKVTGKQTESRLRNSDDLSPKFSQREYFESRPSNLTITRGEFLDLEDKGLSGRIAKEAEFCGKRKGISEYCDPVRVQISPADEMRVAKRVRDEFPRQQYARKAPIGEMPLWTNQIGRSAAEMPTSFSEDETAETISSMD